MTICHSISFARHWRSCLALAAILCLLAPAAEAQQTYKTPTEAADALAAAVKSGVRKEMLRVLGSDAADIISSGDEVADGESRARFSAAYDVKHSVTLEGDSLAALEVGLESALETAVMATPIFSTATQA